MFPTPNHAPAAESEENNYLTKNDDSDTTIGLGGDSETIVGLW